MTIWSADNLVRHPWFDLRGKKRRHTSHDHTHSSSDESDVPERPHLIKRRRCSVLEHGLANLSLQLPSFQEHEPLSINQDDTAISTYSLEECAMDADDVVGGGRTPVLMPGSIEEPEQDIPEIQMKTSSWYELAPDRIVITDLDSFESDGDNPGENERVLINANLLEYIKKPKGLVIPCDQATQALVLYRPLPPVPVVDPLKGPDRTEMQEIQRGAAPMEVES